MVIIGIITGNIISANVFMCILQFVYWPTRDLFFSYTFAEQLIISKYDGDTAFTYKYFCNYANYSLSGEENGNRYIQLFGRLSCTQKC